MRGWLHHETTKHFAPADPGVVGEAWLGLTHALKPIRMPVFFVVSGLFAAGAVRRPWAQVRRRPVSAYYLYVVWLLLLGGVFAVERTLPMNRTQDLGELVEDLVLASTGAWFLYALAIYFVLTKLLLPVPTAWLLGAVALLTVASPAIPLDEVNRVSVLAHFGYFVFGARCAPVVWRLARSRRVPALPLLAVGYVALAILLDLLEAPGGIRLLLLSLVGVPAAILGAVALARRSRVAEPLAWIGRRTLPVYVLHVPLLALAQHLPVWPGHGREPVALVLTAAYPLLVAGVVAGGCLALHAGLRRLGFGFLFELPQGLARRLDGRPGEPRPVRVGVDAEPA